MDIESFIDWRLMAMADQRKETIMYKSKLSGCLKLLFTLMILATSVQHAAGQSTAEVRFYSPAYGRYVSRFSGRTLTVEKSDSPQNFTRRGCENGDTPCGHWEGTSTAQVSDLDLDNVTIQEGCCDAFGLTSKQGFGFMIGCKGGEKCVSQVGRFTGYSANLGSPNGLDTNLVISCETRDQCTNFLKALNGKR
jgi:hypothetical protein